MEARRTFVVRADVCLGDNPRRMSLAIYNCMVMPNNIFQALDPGNIVQELEGIQEPGAAAAVQRATAAAAEVVTISSQERLVQLRDDAYLLGISSSPPSTQGALPALQLVPIQVLLPHINNVTNLSRLLRHLQWLGNLEDQPPSRTALILHGTAAEVAPSGGALALRQPGGHSGGGGGAGGAVGPFALAAAAAEVAPSGGALALQQPGSHSGSGGGAGGAVGPFALAAAAAEVAPSGGALALQQPGSHSGGGGHSSGAGWAVGPDEYIPAAEGPYGRAGSAPPVGEAGAGGAGPGPSSTAAANRRRARPHLWTQEPSNARNLYTPLTGLASFPSCLQAGMAGSRPKTKGMFKKGRGMNSCLEEQHEHLLPWLTEGAANR
jgi:hypothetical protein